MTLTYDKNFFSQMDGEAIRSARVVVPLVNGWLHPRSVLDVGGGTGGWTAAFAASGVADYLCVDGAYVDRKALQVPSDHFREFDLSQPLDLNRRFDLVVCLEVAEHLPAAAAAGLISSLTRHSNAVLFSAAIPHQKGTYHVNLQWPVYWAELFASQGYSCFDRLRPAIWNDPNVSCWYKQNALLYLNEAGLAQATDAEQLRHTLVKSPSAMVHPDLYLFSMQEFDALRCLYQPPPLGWALKALAKSAKSLLRRQARHFFIPGNNVGSPDAISPQRVTWLIPVLNGMPYLPVALDSIRSQTYTNYEVHVWDNGSTDGSLEELNRWIPDRLPGRIITGNPLPLGVCLARLVEQASTVFCARFDADDVNHPDRLEKQISAMRADPGIAALGAQMRQIDPQGNDHGVFTNYPLGHQEIIQEMLVSNALGHPNVVFRRDAVLAVGNYRDFSPTHVEDYDLWLRLAAAGHRLANLGEALIDYRVHASSTTQKSIAANRLRAEMTRRLAEAAPKLYGCDSATMTRLSERTCRPAIVPLRQIAKHIANGNNPWRSPVFYHAARSMIGEADRRSRIAAAFEHGGIPGAAAEMKVTAASAVRSVMRRGI